ncbi:MAG: AAA family ATPase [Chromatiaceae bacterium]
MHFIAGVVDHTGTRAFDPATDGQVLSDEIALMDPPPTLLIVDPIVAAVAGDSHKNAEVRRALQPLVDLAQVRRCAVLGISHFSKGTAGRDPVERVTGSLAFGALARVVLAAAKLPDAEGGGRMLARAKNNIAMDSGGFKYELVPLELPGYPGVFTTLVRWGEALKGTARELLGRAETAVDPDERSATDEAAEWLRELLSAGPMKAADVQKEARQAGINDKPLRTARERLGVKPKKSGFSAGWWWSLPAAEDALSAEDAQDAKVRISGSFEPGEGNFGPGPCPGDPEGAQDAPSCPSENEGTFEDGGHLRELATTSTGGARDGDGWESF